MSARSSSLENLTESSKTTTELGSNWVMVSRTFILKRVGVFGEVRVIVHKETNVRRCVKVLRKSAMSERELK